MKIATIFFKYDYGIEARGEGLEKKVLLPAIQDNCDEVVSFWIEENGYPENVDELQKKVIEFAEKENPDILFFILMSDEIKLETLEMLSKKYITVNWFCDDQWRFESFTKFVAPMLIYSVTMDKYSIEKYKKINCKYILSQWAAMDYIENIEFKNIQYKYDISFIGGKNITREWYIYELRKAGYKVECFGAGWGSGRISYEEMKHIFLNSKINLNLSNSIPNDVRFYKYLVKNIFKFGNEGIKGYIKKVRENLGILFVNSKKRKNIEQMKARNFEICGFGGFQLSQYSLELEDYYEIGKEISIFTNIDELKLQINYFLENENKRKEMTERAYRRTENYTYNYRIKNIVEEIRNEKGLHSS